MMCVLVFSTSNNINTIMSSFLVGKLRPRNLKEVEKPGFECGHEEASVLLTCLTAVSGANHLLWDMVRGYSPSWQGRQDMWLLLPYLGTRKQRDVNVNPHLTFFFPPFSSLWGSKL